MEFINPNVINKVPNDATKHEIFEREKIKVITTIALSAKEIVYLVIASI